MQVNCGNCKHLTKTGGFVQVVGCGLTGFVVPQHTIYTEGIAIFKRVPIECPLPDDAVSRSEDEQPRDTWTTMKITDITLGKRKCK